MYRHGNYTTERDALLALLSKDEEQIYRLLQNETMRIAVIAAELKMSTNRTSVYVHRLVKKGLLQVFKTEGKRWEYTTRFKNVTESSHKGAMAAD